VLPCLATSLLSSAGVPWLSHLTLLNVDVTDAVMHQLARTCPRLQHLAIGRTENNAFGNFVSDAGLAVLAASCQLNSLCLFRCYSVSDTGLAELTQQDRQLTNLVLHSCPQVRAVDRVAVGIWFWEHRPPTPVKTATAAGRLCYVLGSHKTHSSSGHSSSYASVLPAAVRAQCCGTSSSSSSSNQSLLCRVRYS
jgi:hypothetical protein